VAERLRGKSQGGAEKNQQANDAGRRWRDRNGRASPGSRTLRPSRGSTSLPGQAIKIKTWLLTGAREPRDGPDRDDKTWSVMLMPGRCARRPGQARGRDVELGVST